MNFIYGFPGDSLGYLVYLQNFLTKGWPSSGFFQSIFSPQEPQQTLLSLILTTPALFLGPIWAFDAVVGSTFLANFLVTFYAARRLLSRSASLLTALTVSTSLFVQWQATRSIEMAMLFWLAPLSLFLLRFWEKRSWSEVFWVAFFSSLTFLTSFHLGYFALIEVSLTFLFIFGDDLRRRRFVWHEALKFLLFFIFTFFILTLPATLPLFGYLKGNLPEKPTAKLDQAFSRNKLPDLIAFGARPWDYVLPSIYHPLWGRGVQSFYTFLRSKASYQFWSPYLPERVNFLPWTALVLTLAGLISKFKDWERSRFRRSEKVSEVSGESRRTAFFLYLTVAMFAVSLPAVLHLKLVSFYLPSFFLFKIFPVFRVYARAGAFVLVNVAFLAGYGWEFLLTRIKNNQIILRFGRFEFTARKSVLLMSLLVGLIVFENLNFPPLPVTDLSQIPKVYAFLKTEKEKGRAALIIEYPKDTSGNDYGGGCPEGLAPAVLRDYNGIYEDYYQTFHGQAVFDYQKLSRRERALLPFLEKRETYELLKKYRVTHVVVHSQESMVAIHPWPYPQENPLDECWARRVMKKPERVYEKFKKAIEFDDGVVYSLQ